MSTRHSPASRKQDSPLCILIADDHPIVREGLTALINSHRGMRVVAAASSGAEAIELANRHAPNLAVLDISMPDMNGIETAERLLEEHPKLRILALTRHADAAHLHRMLQAGAHGYLLKQAAADSLLSAIERVAGGGTFVDPQLRPYLLESRLNFSRDALHVPPLAPRETTVLTLVAWGNTNAEIAEQLNISVKTVESYKADAMSKLRLKSRAELVRYASASGWLDDDKAPDGE